MTEWWHWVCAMIIVRAVLFSVARIDPQVDPDLTPHLPAAYARKRKGTK